MILRKILLTMLIPTIMYGAGKNNKFITKPNIDWHDHNDVKGYIKDNYHKDADNLIRLIDIESDFRPFAKNPTSSAIGFTQITKKCAADVGFAYNLVARNPIVNIHAGYLYFMKCMAKAGNNFDKAYEYYNKGLYYDQKLKESMEF